MSPSTIRRMVSFFARHEVDKSAEGFERGEDGYPSAGRVAWELWGGDAGRAWAEKVAGQMAAADTREKESAVSVDPEWVQDLVAAVADESAPADPPIQRERIVSREGRFCVVSEDGSRSFGCYDTESEAEARLEQVERFKRIEESQRERRRTMTRAQREGLERWSRWFEGRRQAEGVEANLALEVVARVEGTVDFGAACQGQCEGTGLVPVRESDELEPWATLFRESEGEADEAGYKLVECPECSGTGTRRMETIGGAVGGTCHRLGQVSALSQAQTEDVNPGPDYSAGWMVCWRPDPDLAEKLAVTDGLPPADLHVTLAYLPEVRDPDLLAAAIEAAASSYPPLPGRISGVGRFVGADGSGDGDEDGGDPFVALVDVPGLEDLRAAIVEAIEGSGAADVSASHGFTAHLTLAYLSLDDDELPIEQVEPTEVVIGEVRLVRGSEGEDAFPLVGEEQPNEDYEHEDEAGDEDEDQHPASPFPVVESSSPSHVELSVGGDRFVLYRAGDGWAVMRAIEHGPSRQVEDACHLPSGSSRGGLICLQLEHLL